MSPASDAARIQPTKKNGRLRTAVVAVQSPLRTPDDLRWLARHWATRIGVKLTQVHLRAMTSKWASMSTTGRLTLNTELIDLPRPLAEYVVVHELVHLLAPNHGKVFKSFLTAYLPDWRERDHALRTIGHGDLVITTSESRTASSDTSPSPIAMGEGLG